MLTLLQDMNKSFAKGIGLSAVPSNGESVSLYKALVGMWGGNVGNSFLICTARRIHMSELTKGAGV